MSISDVPRLQERLMMSLYKLIYSSPFFRRLIREMVDDADQTVHFLTALFPSLVVFSSSLSMVTPRSLALWSAPKKSASARTILYSCGPPPQIQLQVNVFTLCSFIFSSFLFCFQGEQIRSKSP